MFALPTTVTSGRGPRAAAAASDAAGSGAVSAP